MRKKMRADDERLQLTAFGLRRYAVEYLQVADAGLAAYRAELSEVKRRHTVLAPFAVYFNYLHAVELALKAYMVHTGSPLSELRSGTGVGHDLRAALNFCHHGRRLRDHVELSSRVLETIRACSGTYRQKDFEYIRRGSVALRPIDDVKEAAAAVVEGMLAVEMLPGRDRE
jgi:hypothetical protein